MWAPRCRLRTHEDNRGLEAPAARLRDEGEASLVVDALLESNLRHPNGSARVDRGRSRAGTNVVGLLDRLPVRERVGERNTQLDHVRPTGLHGEHERDRVGDAGEAGGEESDEDGLILNARRDRRRARSAVRAG